MDEITQSACPTAKTTRRSSILKPAKLKLHSFFDSTNVTSTKRVSFAGMRIKEFSCSSSKSTNWGSSYEESFNVYENENTSEGLNTTRANESTSQSTTLGLDISMSGENQSSIPILCNQSLNTTAIVNNFETHSSDDLHNRSNDIFFMPPQDIDEDSLICTNRSQFLNNFSVSSNEEFTSNVELNMAEIFNSNSKCDIFQAFNTTEEISLTKPKSDLFQNVSSQTDVYANNFPQKSTQSESGMNMELTEAVGRELIYENVNRYPSFLSTQLIDNTYKDQKELESNVHFEQPINSKNRMLRDYLDLENTWPNQMKNSRSRLSKDTKHLTQQILPKSNITNIFKQNKQVPNSYNLIHNNSSETETSTFVSTNSNTHCEKLFPFNSRLENNVKIKNHVETKEKLTIPNLNKIENLSCISDGLEIEYSICDHVFDSSIESSYSSNQRRRTLYRPSSIQGDFTSLFSDEELDERTSPREDNAKFSRRSSRCSNIFETNVSLLKTPSMDKTIKDFSPRQSIATIRGNFTQILNISRESDENFETEKDHELTNFNIPEINHSSTMSIGMKKDRLKDLLNETIERRFEQSLLQQDNFELLNESPLKLDVSFNSPTKTPNKDTDFHLDMNADPFDWTDEFPSHSQKQNKKTQQQLLTIKTMPDEQKIERFASLLSKLQRIKELNENEQLILKKPTVPTLMEAIQLKNRRYHCNWTIEKLDEEKWYFSFLQGINSLKIKFKYGSERFSASMINKNKDSLRNISLFLSELLIRKFNLLHITLNEKCDIMQLLDALSNYEDELLVMNASHETISTLYDNDYKFGKFYAQVDLDIFTKVDCMQFQLKINFRYWPDIKEIDIDIIDLNTQEQMEYDMQMKIKRQILSLTKGPTFFQDAIYEFKNYFKAT